MIAIPPCSWTVPPATFSAASEQYAGVTAQHAMDCNSHKAALVHDIYEPIFAADPEHPDVPRPRPRA